MQAKMNVGSALLWMRAAVLCLLVQKGLSCGGGWLTFGSKCYKIFSSELKTHAISRLKCFQEGAELVSLSSQDILDFLIPHIAIDTSGSVWVGLRLHWDGDHSWADGTPEEGKPWVVFQSRPDDITRRTFQPTFDFSPLGCFAYDGAKVERQNCFERKSYICERQKSEEKPKSNCRNSRGDMHSFIGEVSGRCIFHTFGRFTYEKKDEACQLLGGEFLDLDEIMRDGLTSFHERQVFSNDGSKYWTAMHWNGNEITWSSGKKLQSDLQFPLYPGSGGCVAVSFNFSDALETHLYQTECSEKVQVVCSAPDSLTTLAPTTVAQEMLRCPQGHSWKTDAPNGYCYWETSYETSRLSWSGARNFCKGYGGDLASFHSKNEEKIGLGFQYGTHPHPFWIGLKLDLETETYRWSDGSPLDYENWAPGHPDHKDKILQCVAMNGAKKHWEASLCGMVSWFVCKVPMQVNPRAPAVFTEQPMSSCVAMGSDSTDGFLFQGYCYFINPLGWSWHRAQQFCENNGASLASLHSVAEIELLLKLHYDGKSTFTTNSLWIGLNTLQSRGIYQWSDGTFVDFTFWDVDEPENPRNLKCTMMSATNGWWSTSHCGAERSSICKRRVDDTLTTPFIPSTADPTIGNCKKGWYSHHDRCYLFAGWKQKDKLNWTEAVEACDREGGYLVSIRNYRDQVFLAYLLQELKGDAWIGFHDAAFSGMYLWLDNSPLEYTNWAPGEPSHFLLQEHCVKMVYKYVDSGIWKDDVCSRKLPYICYMQKDPKLKPVYERGTSCLHPEGWLRMDTQCFNMYHGNPLSWQEAEQACRREGAHLISIDGPSVQAVAAYLGAEVNSSFWISLRYDRIKQQFWWLNGAPMSTSKWGYADDFFTSEKNGENSGCFISTSDGYWTSEACSNSMPYICQITTEISTKSKRYVGNCTNTSSSWSPSDGSFCYLLDGIADWSTASQKCFMLGSELVSLHSLDDVQALKKLLTPNIQSFYIGLRRNEKGGFYWMDNSPVDFINWAQGQPETNSSRCVEASSKDLKWKVVPCSATKHYACAIRKGQEDNSPQIEKLLGDSPANLSAVAWTAILVCCTLIVLAISIAAFYYKPFGKSRGRFFRWPKQSMSFENALFNVDTASMEFRDQHRDSGQL